MGSYFTFLFGCFVGGGFCLVGFWLGFLVSLFGRGGCLVVGFLGFFYQQQTFKISFSVWKRLTEIRNAKYTKANICNTTCASTEIVYSGNASGLVVFMSYIFCFA